MRLSLKVRGSSDMSNVKEKEVVEDDGEVIVAAAEEEEA